MGEYGKNKWGLCDMHYAIVWQWCADYYGPYNDDLKYTDPLQTIKHYDRQCFCVVARRNYAAES